LPTIAALGAGGAIAAAAIPSADGTIHACYQTNTGASGFTGDLRVIDGSNECGNTEQAISWNQQGPQGVPGVQGPKGDQGNKGDQGDAAPTDVRQPTAQAFVKIDGIAGGSTDKAHKGDIDVKAFSWGTFHQGGSGGGGASKTQFRDLSFTKPHDRASTKLFRTQATGQTIKSATFSIFQNGAETIRYKLTNVTVESFQTNDSVFDQGENITLAPQKVEISFHDGGTTLTSSFDVKTNKKPVINGFAFKTPAR
jgi:type VI secretion system secreted protein Hcp